MAVVAIHNLCKRFGSVQAVDGISLTVNEGEFVTLLGPSGCGKTTSLRLIGGLEENDSGEIIIGDQVVSAPAKGILVPPEKRGLGMVFQSYAIWPHMTVFNNVAFPLRIRRFSKAMIKEKVDKVLTLAGIENLAQRFATQLSGGQQQRVAIARALVVEPSVLLMDEPLSNLDAKLRERMRVELLELQRRTRITTIYVTHDQAEAMVLSDRIVVMNRGRIEQAGTAQEIYESPSSMFVSDFVGAANLFEVDLLGLLEDRRIRMRAKRNGREFVSAGQNVSTGTQSGLALIRPESLKFVAAGEALKTNNTFDVVIESAIYLGDRRDYEVSDGGLRFRVRSDPDQIFHRGDRVLVHVTPNHIVFLGGERIEKEWIELKYA
jgi:iron(III) transport system ATP-binding protein